MTEADPTPREEGRPHGLESGALGPRLGPTPLVDVLTVALEQARASYRDGRRAEAIAQATRVAREAGTQHSDDLAAISGSAAAVVGLCQQYDGQYAEARQAFTRAAAALRGVPKLVAERGDYAADLGTALAALCETDGDAGAAEAESVLRHAVELGESTPDVRRSLAIALRVLGRPDDAVKLLAATLGRAPRDWQAAAELAMALEASGAPNDDITGAWARAALVTYEFGPAAQAAPMFDRAGTAAITDPDVLTTAGRAWSQSGRYEDAIRVLERVISLQDDHLDAWLGLAEAHWSAGHTDQALAAYREVLRRDPDVLPALLGFAEIALLYLGQPDLIEEAERYARRVTVLAPEQASGHLALGEALRLAGRNEEAVLALDEAIARLVPDEPLMAFGLGSRGQARLALGDLTRAISDLEDAAGRAPELAWVQSELGTALMAAYYADGDAGQGERLAYLATALDHLRRAVELNPFDVGAAVRLADAEAESGDYPGAEQTLLAALEAAPDSGEVHLALARVRYGGGQYAEALESAEQAEAIGDDARPWLLQGQILVALDRNLEALTRLEHALRLAPDDPKVLSWLGGVERLLGRLPEAIAHLSEALRRQPGDGWALTSRGAAYLQSGDAASGADDLCAALDAGETTPFLISWLEQAVGDRDVAVRILSAWDRAVERTPGDVELRVQLGVAYVNIAMTDAEPAVKARHADLASKHLDLVVQVDSSDPGVLLGLAAARFMRGDEEEARVTVGRLLALKPDADNLTNAANVLSQIERYPEALELAEQALAEQSDAVGARIVQGQALFALGRFPEAEQALSAVPDDYQDASVWTIRGEIHRVTGRPADAVEELARADRLAPDDAWTLASLGAAQIASGQVEPGLASLRRALEIVPTYLFALAQLRVALADLGRNAEAVTALAAAVDQAPDNTDIKIEYAIALGVAGKHRKALAAADDVLLREPDSTTGLRVAGWLLMLMGRGADAVASYSRAAELTPDDFDALTDLADALVATKRSVEALPVLDRATAIKQTASVAVLRSRILADLALWPAAIAAGEQAVALDDADPSALGALGWATAHHRPANAQRMHEIFRTVVDLDAKDPWAHKELAEALLRLKRTDEAHDEYRRAIELSLDRPPNDFNVHWIRGWCLFRLGSHREAAAAYSQAESGLDAPVGLLMDMGLNALVAGNGPEARTGYDRALALASRDPSPTLRGELAIGDLDLRGVIDLGQPTEEPLTSELLGLIREAFEAHPLPEGIVIAG